MKAFWLVTGGVGVVCLVVSAWTDREEDPWGWAALVCLAAAACGLVDAYG